MAGGPILKILLIEDDPAHLLMTRRALRELGPAASVSSASSLGEAAALLSKESLGFNLLLVDLNLNNECGLDVFKILRAAPRLSGVPVLILSTSPTLEDMQRSYAAGANCYLIKLDDLAQFQRDLLAAIRFFGRACSP
jgi:CheY-like chemotaxis protein